MLSEMEKLELSNVAKALTQEEAEVMIREFSNLVVMSEAGRRMEKAEYLKAIADHITEVAYG